MCDDFDAFLAEIGLTHEQMAEAKAAMPEPEKCPDDGHISIGSSAIEGVGCFTEIGISGRIAKLWDGGGWYVAGRHINHSPNPNAEAVFDGGAMFAVGTVAAGEEVTLDYRQVRKLWESRQLGLYA